MVILVALRPGGSEVGSVAPAPGLFGAQGSRVLRPGDVGRRRGPALE